MKLVDDGGNEDRLQLSKLSKSDEFITIVQFPINKISIETARAAIKSLSEEFKANDINAIIIPIPDSKHKLIFNKVRKTNVRNN